MSATSQAVIVGIFAASMAICDFGVFGGDLEVIAGVVS